MRYFNTTGPCDPELHYMVPAIERLPQARQYITFGQYFDSITTPGGHTVTLLRA